METNLRKIMEKTCLDLLKENGFLLIKKEIKTIENHDGKGVLDLYILTLPESPKSLVFTYQTDYHSGDYIRSKYVYDIENSKLKSFKVKDYAEIEKIMDRRKFTSEQLDTNEVFFNVFEKGINSLKLATSFREKDGSFKTDASAFFCIVPQINQHKEKKIKKGEKELFDK